MSKNQYISLIIAVIALMGLIFYSGYLVGRIAAVNHCNEVLQSVLDSVDGIFK